MVEIARKIRPSAGNVPCTRAALALLRSLAISTSAASTIELRLTTSSVFDTVGH